METYVLITTATINPCKYTQYAQRFILGETLCRLEN